MTRQHVFANVPYTWTGKPESLSHETRKRFHEHLQYFMLKIRALFSLRKFNTEHMFVLMSMYMARL